MKRIVALAALSAMSFAANAQNTTTSTSTSTKAPAASTAAVPAAGSTTATIADTNKEAAPKRLTFLATSLIETSEQVVKDASKAEYSFTNYVGASYKLNDTDKVYAKHYFDYSVKPDQTDSGKMLDTVVQYLTKTKGLLGSDDITPLFWYYLPTSQASRDANSNGALRMDAEVNWTLNPKVSVSYLFNPRQSIIPDGEVTVAGKKTATFAKTTLVHQANAYYSINDNIQTYVNAGFIHRWNTAKGSYLEEHVISAVGASIQVGKVNINPEISNDVTTRSSEKATGNTRYWQNDDITYALALALAI